MEKKTNREFEYKGYWLFKRPDTGKYCIAWWPAGGPQRHIRRKATGTSDVDEAKRKLIAFADGNDGEPARIAQLIVAEPAAPRLLDGKDPPVLDVLCDYIERLAERPSYRTAIPALRIWTDFFDQFRVRLVSDLTLDVQEEFVRWRKALVLARGGGTSNSMPARELGVLKAALRDAWKRGRLNTVPYIKSVPTPPPSDRFLTVEEVQRLLAACDQPHLRLFVLLALHTLQRPVAILDLHISQVDLVNNRIDFLPPGAVQSKKRRPVVPITPTLRPELERAVKESISGYVVEWEGRKVKGIRTAFRRACRKAGLTRCSPYVLRHTGPTLLAAAGVPLRQISGFLGHSDTRTTELYAKHRPDFLSDAASKINELFAVAPGNCTPVAPRNCAPFAPRGANTAESPVRHPGHESVLLPVAAAPPGPFLPAPPQDEQDQRGTAAHSPSQRSSPWALQSVSACFMVPPDVAA